MFKIEKVNVEDSHQEESDYQQFNVDGNFVDEEEDYIKDNKVQFMNIVRNNGIQNVKVDNRAETTNITQQFINRLKKKWVSSNMVV